MAILKPGQLASGSYTISGSFSGSFQGSGAGLNNIPSSAIVGLSSTQIASGAVTASVSTGTGSFTVTSGSSTFMFISSSGNVGIGTTTPTAKLDITQQSSGVTTIGKFSSAAQGNYVEIKVGDSYAGSIAGYQNAGTKRWEITNTGDITLNHPSSVPTISGQGQLRLSGTNTVAVSSGNFLIGTTTDAGFRLDVNGTARVKGVGSTNATTAFTIINSSGSELLTISDSNISTFAGGNGRIVTNVIRLNYINSANDNYTIMQSNGSTGNAKFYQGISIGTSSDPVASAQVEIVSPTKGFLPPRTNLTSNISTPAQGLITYLTGSTNEGLYYYNSGSAIGWHKVLTNSGSQEISGSLNVNNSLNVTGNSVSIGTTSINNVFPLLIRSQFYPGILIQNSLTGTNSTSSFDGFAMWMNYDVTHAKALITNYENNGIAIYNGTNTNVGLNIFGSTNNVSINTTTDAGYKLDVNGTARVQDTLGVNGSVTANLASSGTGYEGYKIQDGGTARFVAERLVTNFLGIGHNSVSGRWDDVILGASQRLYFYTGASERARFAATTGNFLINTTTDDGFRLDVNGNSRIVASGDTPLTVHSIADTKLLITGITGKYASLNIKSGTTANWDIGTQDNTGNQLVFRNASTARMLITTGGNVLIGTTTDAGFRLDVNGTARVQGNITQSGANTASLGYITNGIGVYSNAPSTGIWGMIIGCVSNSGHTAIFTKGNNAGSTAIRVTDQNIGASVNHFLVDVNGASGFGLPNGTTQVNSSAQVQIDSTSKGFLPPRMTGAQAEAISSPAEGLMVYATSGSGATITSKGWWGYDGATWVKLN